MQPTIMVLLSCAIISLWLCSWRQIQGTRSQWNSVYNESSLASANPSAYL